MEGAWRTDATRGSACLLDAPPALLALADEVIK